MAGTLGISVGVADHEQRNSAPAFFALLLYQRGPVFFSQKLTKLVCISHVAWRDVGTTTGCIVASQLHTMVGYRNQRRTGTEIETLYFLKRYRWLRRQ